jgi:topoisomerase IA-like protein
MTLDRAGELLAERRNAEPSSRPRKAARPTKKATKKPAKKVAKKTIKKSPAKKATGTVKRAAVAQGAKSNAALIAAAHPEE